MQKFTTNRKDSVIKRALSRISRHTIKLLNIILPVLLLIFIHSAVIFYIGIKSDPIKALALYSSVSEYLMMSLFLTIGGAVLLDISLFERGEK